MRNYSFNTALSIYPTQIPGEELIYITRGATASLAFDFATKIYSFDNVDQLTFLFKQGDTITWFKMFSYIIETEDETLNPNKTYFSQVEVIDGNRCSGMEVNSPVANPKAAGYYEVVEDGHDKTTTKYIVDPRFYHNSGIGFDYITLTLSTRDTLRFNPTPLGKFVTFEVALRLNTDNFATLSNSDSIIIEPQFPIMVVDSLYGKLGGC
jgi:hypothetical protein